MSTPAAIPPGHRDAVAALWESVPHLRVSDDAVVHVSEAVTPELGCDVAPLLGPFADIGTRLDDATFADLLAGDAAVRVRLGHELGDCPIRLRHLGVVGDETWVEVRSLADEFRMESLLRENDIEVTAKEPNSQVAARPSSASADTDVGGDDRAALRDDLRTAISLGQLTLHYQPLVPLTEGLERGYESLARWDHPTQGMIDAKQVFDLAEYSGLTSELGHELLRLACDDQRTWIADDDGFLSVNLSASQLSEPDAATSFVERMRRRGVSTRQIVIELTEAGFAGGPNAQRNLDVFRDTGVRIFLDGFGVGSSSLSHLHQLPVDGIKVDASIISPDVDEDLIRLIVGKATTLGIRTVAKGIETSTQLETVTRLGVDYAQGYLLGRPTRTPTSKQLP